jgi:hypothetical protein
MNTLLLLALASCPPGAAPGCPPSPAPVAAYPDAGPASSGCGHQGRFYFFGRRRGHHHNNKCPCAGNGHAGGDWTPPAAAPGAYVGTDIVLEAVTPEPDPAGDAPPAVPGQAPRLVPRPQPATNGAEPSLAAPPGDGPRQMPQGPAARTTAEPPRN